MVQCIELGILELELKLFHLSWSNSAIKSNSFKDNLKISNLNSAVVSSGAGGAMAPLLLERLTIRLAKNCSIENASVCNGTTSFENLTMALVVII